MQRVDAKNLSLSDSILIDKIIKYDQFRTKQLTHSIVNGICNSSAICYAAFNAVGKGKWWASFRFLICSWNETLPSLKETYLLVDAEQTMTLEQLFNKIIDYILFHQVIDFKKINFDLGKLSQMTLLEPNGLFEISINGKIEKIQQKLYFVHPINSYLEILLCYIETLFPKIMCFLILNQHTVALRYHEGFWYLHDSPGMFYELQCPKNEIISFLENLYRRYNYGNNVNIILCSFDKRISNYFLKITGSLTIKLALDLNLLVLNNLAKYSPEKFLILLEKLKENKELQKVFFSKLNNRVNSWSLLNTISRFAPACYPILIKMLTQELVLRKPFLKGLKTDISGWTALPLLAYSDVTALESLLFFMYQNPSLIDNLVTALHTKTKESVDPVLVNKSGLDLLGIFAPHTIPDLEIVLHLHNKYDNKKEIKRLSNFS